MRAKEKCPFEIVGCSAQSDYRPPRVVRAIGLISSLPNNQLINQNELAARLNTAPNICRELNWAIPAELKAKDKRGRGVYGNSKTIKAYQEWLRHQ